MFKTLKNLMAPPEHRTSLENPSTPLNLAGALAWLGIGSKSAAGEIINEKTALEHLDVYACVRVISESIASLPCKLYEQLPNGRKEATNHPLYDLFAYQPNPDMTAFTFFEALTGALALTGNCYAEIVRNKGGQPVALYPLHPHQTEPFRNAVGQIAYKTCSGMPNGQWRIIASADMLHVPLFDFDGLKGISPVKMAMQSIGLAKAATKFGARFFGNGSKPGGVMSLKSGNLDEKQMAVVKTSWESTQGGENQGRTAFMPGDWVYTTVGLSPEEAQFLETRRFQRTEIAALFRLSPSQIGDTTTKGRGNHEQEQLSFVTDTLKPYLSRFEQEIIRKLMPSVGRNAGRFFVQFDLRERLRGDFASQMQGLALGKQWGFFSTNFILNELGENSIGPVGDVHLYPLNMGNAEQLLKQPDTEPITQQPVQLALPAPDDAAPTKQERSLLESLTGTYGRVFRDAIGRVSAREQRDSELLSQVFKPLLTSIAEEAERQAEGQLGLNADWHGDLDSLVVDHLKSMDKRAASWTPQTADENAGTELRKAVRSISINIFREAGARVALKGSTNE